jgi:hypothetical protein
VATERNSKSQIPASAVGMKVLVLGKTELIPKSGISCKNITSWEFF